MDSFNWTELAIPLVIVIIALSATAVAKKDKDGESTVKKVKPPKKD